MKPTVSRNETDGICIWNQVTHSKSNDLYKIVMAEKNIVQETFPVLGMSCASCSARVEKTLNHQSGVKKAVVNYASATATVEYDPTSCSSETLQQAVQAAGYDLLINQDGNTLEEAEEAHNKKFSALKFRTT